MPQPNGPRPRMQTGRNRDTLGNKKGGTESFPLSPSDTNAFGVQRGNLKFNYQTQVAQLRFQKTMARALFRSQRGSIQDEATAGQSDLAGSMAERGMIGSTVNAAESEGIKSARDAAIAEAQLGRTAALGESDMGILMAQSQLRMGLGELALSRAAAKRELALQAFSSGGMNPWGYSSAT